MSFSGALLSLQKCGNDILFSSCCVSGSPRRYLHICRHGLLIAGLSAPLLGGESHRVPLWHPVHLWHLPHYNVNQEEGQGHEQLHAAELFSPDGPVLVVVEFLNSRT